MEDLIEFLKICNLKNEKLNNRIKEKCSSVDQFFEMRKKWINLFNMKKKKFKKILKLIGFYKQALIDCTEFHMEDIENTENHEAFIEYLEKNSSFLKENTLDPDIIKVKEEMLKFSYNIYLKSNKTKPDVNELIISQHVTFFTNLSASILCGAFGAALSSISFPVGTILGGVYGVAAGFYLSLNYYSLTMENILDELKVDENLTEEQQYENSLDKLNSNMNSSNKLIKTSRRNYLVAF